MANKRKTMPSVDGSPTNNDRADWALVACQAFAAETGMDDDNEELQTVLSDLMCDLFHLCAREKLDLKQIVSGAATNFEEEVAEAKEDAEEEAADGPPCPRCESRRTGELDSKMSECYSCGAEFDRTKGGQHGNN